MKKISIIIVTYNSEKDIFDCVDSIKTHADIPLEEIELIIVDNNSREPQPMFKRLREQWGEDIICIENQHNGGYGQGNNVGIRRATAPIVLIMNPDVRHIMPFLQKPLDAFLNNPTITMYGMKQMLDYETPSTNSFNVSNTTNGYIATLLSGICNRLDWFFPQFMYLNGSCFFIRKCMFEQIGLFDETIFMYGEENNIHHRMKHQFGSNIIFDKHIKYLHLVGEREVNINAEEKILQSLIYSNQKIGCSATQTIRYKIQGLNTLIIKEKISAVCGNKEAKHKINVYKEYKEKLQQKLELNNHGE